MITYDQYINKWKKDITPEIESNIKRKLLPAVWTLQSLLLQKNIILPLNTMSDTNISGLNYGGFRPKICPIGADKSNHKLGLAVDVYDPKDFIDKMLLDNLDLLEDSGIWLEHPDSTKGWSHWQAVPPKSGNRVFLP